MQKFKASISRGNPPDGTLKCVVSLKDNGGGRWEFVGTTPLAAGKTMMAICASGGRCASVNAGLDEGIAAAFPDLAGGSHG